jgi:hypothetical protein
MDLTKEDLEKLLREAEEAHGEYEQTSVTETTIGRRGTPNLS